MVLIEHLKLWIRASFRDDSLVEITVDQASSGGDHEYRVRLYTATNRYTIGATQREDGGYLGCTATSRKARPGEQKFRGNDLPDGKLTEETWHQILAGIVRYELQTICRPASTTQDVTDEPT